MYDVTMNGWLMLLAHLCIPGFAGKLLRANLAKTTSARHLQHPQKKKVETSPRSIISVDASCLEDVEKSGQVLTTFSWDQRFFWWVKYNDFALVCVCSKHH